MLIYLADMGRLLCKERGEERVSTKDLYIQIYNPTQYIMADYVFSERLRVSVERCS